MAAFLQKEYGTTGKGFEFDGKQLAVWFNEDGMRVGYGTSTERPVLQMNWQEVEAKIRSQVVNGTYMGANEAYLTDEAERDRIAGHLFFFFRDGMGELPEELGLRKMEVAYKQELEIGPASILCCVDGTVREFDAEITRIDMNHEDTNKSFVIQVTDPELLELTGGIVQGMSGSPVIQNGKFVGAVTHVFIQDSTGGYGIFAENMLENI